MSLKLSPEKAHLFKILLDQVANINPHINVHFRVEDGLYIQGMDHSRVCLFDISLTKEMFEEYTFEKELVVGINLEIVNKIFACRSKDQYLVIETGEESDNISISMVDGSSSDYDKFFETSIYSFDQDLLNVPDEEHDIDISINSNLFTNVIEQIALFGGCVRFECKDTGITLISKENKINTTMTTQIGIDKIESYTTIDEEQYNEYNMSYFVKLCGFTKLMRKDDNIDIKITKDSPIIMNYSIIGDNSAVEGNIKMCLAPKISEDG